jgi:hypothetical protein
MGSSSFDDEEPKLDPDCVAALLAEREEVEALQRHFREDVHG